MSKILVFSIPPIHKDINNTFENIFKSICGDHELYFLCCRDGNNKSDVFDKKYALSEIKAIKSITDKTIDVFQISQEENKKTELNIYKKNHHFHNLKRIARDSLWMLSRWKKSSLKSFLEENSFDYIVAPSEGYHYYLRILDFICKTTHAKLIFYTWDDNFTFKQRQLSPLFFFYRMKTRHLLKKIAEKYLFKSISISEKTKEEADAFFKSNSVIIKKTIPENVKNDSNHQGIKMIYGGNLLNGREKSLLKIASVIQKDSFDSITLDVYSNINNKKIIKKLEKYKNVFIHGSISHDELIKQEANSDIGLILESLSFTKRKISRLSISTKFTDYIGAGLPIFAIIDDDSATSLEIKNNKLGHTASTTNHIEDALYSLIAEYKKGDYKKTIPSYQEKYGSKKQNIIVNQLFL